MSKGQEGRPSGREGSVRASNEAHESYRRLRFVPKSHPKEGRVGVGLSQQGRLEIAHLPLAGGTWSMYYQGPSSQEKCRVELMFSWVGCS